MKKHKNRNADIFYIVIIAAIIGTIGINVWYANVIFPHLNDNRSKIENTYIVTITGGNRITYTYPIFLSEKTVYMYVVSGIDMETGERITFKCVDDASRLKWNSSDYFYELTDPDNRSVVYRIIATGVREPWNDEYQNIVRFELVHDWYEAPPLTDDQRIERIINKFGEIRAASP